MRRALVVPAIPDLSESIPTQVEAGQQEVVIKDDDSLSALRSILKELKKVNLHLSTMTDMVIKDEDINDV